MKLFKILFCFAFAVLAVSCSNDDDSNDDQSPITEPFFVKVNGQDFTPLEINATVAGSSILIEAINSQDKDVVIGFSETVEARDVLSAGVFGSNGTAIFMPIYDSDNGGFFATNGTLTIASHNRETNEISGRFNFSGPDPDNSSSTINFTEGEFKVTYVNQ
ncbi:DUF6252 family protein [Sediminibacter sp. Hel_I_10]|uniref:DUF6252 family protein n=1 Tax=Sediminibacter sp. Hel_I_10 TaxID=1392490 RepID=UPI00047B849D|nr:DUF6252 family protein [Sediminibacter sp. Hel_I_10]